MKFRVPTILTTPKIGGVPHHALERCIPHTPPGATAKTVHHFYFNKDPPSFINATDAGAMAFKNECASVRSAGASLMRGSAKRGASAARAIATGAKVKTTAVKDEEQPQQQQVQQQQLQQQAAVQQATLQLLQQQQRVQMAQQQQQQQQQLAQPQVRAMYNTMRSKRAGLSSSEDHGNLSTNN